RRDDIPPLLHHFLTLFAQQYHRAPPQLPSTVLAQIAAYDWPGNVREVRNVAERLIVRGVAVVDPATLAAVIKGKALVQKPDADGVPGGPPRTPSSQPARRAGRIARRHTRDVHAFSAAPCLFRRRGVRRRGSAQGRGTRGRHRHGRPPWRPPRRPRA